MKYDPDTMIEVYESSHEDWRIADFDTNYAGKKRVRARVLGTVKGSISTDYLVSDFPDSYWGWNFLEEMIYSARFLTISDNIRNYIGKKVIWVSESCIAGTVVVDNATYGCYCKACKDYDRYYTPNQPDGSFLCFRCRSRP
jgi:hypothetical protein